jgi:hypothetical protein
MQRLRSFLNYVKPKALTKPAPPQVDPPFEPGSVESCYHKLAYYYIDKAVKSSQEFRSDPEFINRLAIDCAKDIGGINSRLNLTGSGANELPSNRLELQQEGSSDKHLGIVDSKKLSTDFAGNLMKEAMARPVDGSVKGGADASKMPDPTDYIDEMS